MIDLNDLEWTFRDYSLAQRIGKVSRTCNGHARYFALDNDFEVYIDEGNLTCIKQTFYLNLHGDVANIVWEHDLSGVDHETCVRGGDG